MGQHDGDFHIAQANALCTIVSRLLSITLCRRMRQPVTAVLSEQRLSKIKFDKLLMSHQGSPLVERARETVEELVSNTIEQIRSKNNAKTMPESRWEGDF